MARKFKDMTRDEFRATLTEKFDLAVSADADDETFSNALTARLDELAVRDVDAAVASGRILAEHRGFWLASFKNNHIPARAALDALAPVARRQTPSASTSAVVHNTAASTTRPAQRTVGITAEDVSAAAANGSPLTPPAGIKAETLQNAAADAELWEMGFRDGVKPPPQPEWYELFPPKEV
jgi:hypothetical protein